MSRSVSVYDSTGACQCPELDRCCFDDGFCMEEYPRQVCLDQGGTPDCVELPCRDGCLIGDRDSDGDFDLRDCAAMYLCFGGSCEDPGYVNPSGECERYFDFNEDGDVDLEDFRMFWSGLLMHGLSER